MSNAVQPDDTRFRYKLVLLFAVFAMPFVFSYAAYHFWKPGGKLSNYGELLPVRTLDGISGRLPDGRQFSLDQFKGKWVMVQLDGGACDANCRTKLYYMRQVRIAQGREQERIERLWLVQDNARPEADLLKQYEGTAAVRVDTDVRAQFPAAARPEDYIYLVDPLGNLMLRFPKNPDPRGMIKDLKHLLKASQIG